MSDLLTTSGIAAGVAAITSWIFRTFVDQRLRERLARIEAQLNTQSQWMASRLTRTDELRSRSLSRLHARLNRAQRLTDSYIGGQHAGNPETHVENSRIACVRAWIDFDRAFEHAEIFLSTPLADRIRIYGDAIAKARVVFEQQSQQLGTDATLEDRLTPVAEALATLSKLQTDVRPQLIKEIRSALGADAIEIKSF